MKNLGLRNLMLAAALVAAPAVVANAAVEYSPAEQLTKKVRHELVTLPFLGVFDNLAFRIDDGVVTLMGQVNRPTLKSDAERVVARIEGVRGVVNQVEVLPLSPYDDRIRLAVLRAVYGYPALQRYALGAQPSIRIIVKNGEVTLEGVAANEGDKNIINLRANGVAGVFRVTNNLSVEKRKA
ncbi:MAG: BON domain-containing protein [Acidimicrobiia bacterium]|nr:BON domain-containing protein [Acidimicrobiia bacterium]